VAEGTEGTDAVNLDQLTAVADQVGDVAENAIGYDDESRGSVTFAGAEGTRLSNLAAGAIGATSTDAIHGGQMHASLQSAADAIGGGTVVDAGGQLIGTVFSVQGSYHGNVGDALGALDGALTGLDGRVADLEQGTTGLAGNSDGAAAGSAAGATGGNDGVAVDTHAAATGADASGEAAAGTAIGQRAGTTGGGAEAWGNGRLVDEANTVSVGSADNQRRVAHVAQGVNDTDAANVAQVEAGDARALERANAYTDEKFSVWEDNFTALRGEVDERFRHQDRRIDRMGAMSGAYAGMALNTAGLAGRNRVGVGVGAQGGEQAIAVGFQRMIGARASVSFGGAVSGGESSVSAGAGFSW